MAARVKPTRILSRASLFLFAVAMVTMLAELSWWTWLNLRTSARERQNHLERLARDADIAERMVDALVARDAAAGQWTEDAREREAMRVQALFPGVTFAHGHAALRIDAAVDIERRFASHVRMFVAEGAVFIFVLVVGASLLWRALRQEMAIVRQSQNFLSAVTHELKSPLASLRLWVETLQRRPPGPDEWQRPLGILRNDIDRLDTLIGNVLLAARIEATREAHAPLRQDEAMLDVRAPLSRLVEQMQTHAEERGVHLSLTLPVDPAPVPSAIERPALELVVRNLIDNAIKYSGDAKRIEVTLHVEEKTTVTTVITVADFGIGLAKSEQRKIFDKFYRVGDEMVRQSAGTGLGLFLVRAVVEEHGGTVEVLSEGVGHGATFRVMLPLTNRKRKADVA